MNVAKRQQLRRAGYQIFEHAADMLELSKADKEQIDLRIELSREVKKARRKARLSDVDAGKKLGLKRRQYRRLELGLNEFGLSDLVAAVKNLGGKVPMKFQEI